MIYLDPEKLGVIIQEITIIRTTLTIENKIQRILIIIIIITITLKAITTIITITVATVTIVEDTLGELHTLILLKKLEVVSVEIK